MVNRRAARRRTPQRLRLPIHPLGSNGGSGRESLPLGGELRATGRVLHASGRLFHAESSLEDGAGQTLGFGRGAFTRSQIALDASVGYV